jgi:hypothetical protein
MVSHYIKLIRSFDERRTCPACNGKGCHYNNLEEKEKCYGGVIIKY